MRRAHRLRPPLVALALSACAGLDPGERVGSLDLDLPTPAMVIGTIQQASVFVRSESGRFIEHPSVTWSSTQPGVATVNDTGLVTGVAVGSTWISATSGGISSMRPLQVTLPPVMSITVVPMAATLAVGDSLQLSTILRDANGVVLTDRVVSWTSWDTTVVAVTSTGRVTARSLGVATILASAGYGFGVAEITVVGSPP